MQTLQTSPVSLSSKLPTGNVLTRERTRLSLSGRTIAQMLRQPSCTIAAIERKNAVLPPGWIPTLRKLGLAIPEVVWPPTMAPYCGTQLKAEIEAKRSLRFSPFSLRKHLAVSAEELAAVLSGHGLVPSSWLLKLAEIGLEVPQEAKRALSGVTEVCVEKRAAPLPRLPPDDEVARKIPGVSQPIDRLAGLLLERSALLRPSDTLPTPRERPEVSFRWSEDGGIYFSASGPLLDQLPGAFQNLLGLVRASGLATLIERFTLLAQDSHHVPG